MITQRPPEAFLDAANTRESLSCQASFASGHLSPELIKRDGEFGVAGLEELRRLKLATRLEWRVGGLHRQTFERDRDSGGRARALNEHEFALARLAYAFEKRSH